MGDITDLYSTVSRTRVSPQKAFVSSYTLTASQADVSGATLNVANGQYVGAVFGITGSNTAQTVTVYLLINAVISQTFTYDIGTTSAEYFFTTFIYQNTTGLTVSVKLQAKTSVGSNFCSLSNISLLSGSFIIPINSAYPTTFPVNAYVTNLEYIGGVGDADNYFGFNGGNQNNSINTVLVQNINLVKNSFIFYYVLFGSATNITKVGLVAFDFDGKTLAL